MRAISVQSYHQIEQLRGEMCLLTSYLLHPGNFTLGMNEKGCQLDYDINEGPGGNDDKKALHASTRKVLIFIQMISCLLIKELMGKVDGAF